MAWRNQGMTGSNNIPLGKMRRFGGDAQQNDNHNNSSNDQDLKRGRSPERRKLATLSCRCLLRRHANMPVLGPEGDGAPRRRKRNRWGDASDNKAAGLMGLPTAILANMTSEQLEAYTVHLRIEEITQKLKIDDVVPADGGRYVTPLTQLLGSCCLFAY